MNAGETGGKMDLVIDKNFSTKPFIFFYKRKRSTSRRPYNYGNCTYLPQH
eukprot:m.71777 g.71777  ORF g.71777 m.71777 type:complete len:50 (+) comp24392_c0_seq1:383-532(+)